MRKYLFGFFAILIIGAMSISHGAVTQVDGPSDVFSTYTSAGSDTGWNRDAGIIKQAVGTDSVVFGNSSSLGMIIAGKDLRAADEININVKGILGGDYQATILAEPSLVTYLKMDEASWNGTPGEVADSGTGGHSGTSVNGATTSSSFKYGTHSGTFDGVNDYVSIADFIDPVSNDITIEMWIYPTALPGNPGLIGQTNWIAYLYNDGSIAIGIPAVSELKSSSGAITLNSWNHIAFVKNGVVTSIYVDGALKASASTVVWANTANDITIGAQLYSPAYFTGRIDEVAFYSTALSSVTINSHAHLSGRGHLHVGDSTSYVNSTFKGDIYGGIAGEVALTPSVGNSATAVAHTLDTENALTTAGAKIASFKNATVEKSYIDKDGKILTPEIIGSSASLGDLRLSSTSHATKGTINFGTSSYDELTDSLGIGIATPTHQEHVVLRATDNIYIDGATNPRTVTPGAVRQEHRAGIAGTTARFFNMFPAGYDDTKAMNVYYDFEGSSASITASPILIQADVDGATNVNLTALKLSAIGTLDPTVKLDAVGTGIGVRPIHQEVGSIVNAEQGWVETSGPAYADATTAFGSAITNVQLFVNDNDYIYVGKSTTFTCIEALMSIVSSANINATFQYWNGAAWTTLAVVDGTNGFQQNGLIDFEAPGDWGTANVSGVVKYYVRIQRTRNSLTTPPTEATIRICAPTEYIWDEEGNLTIATLKTSGKGEIGDPGFETSGVNINGTTMTDKFRINDFGITDPEQLVLHRHSTVNPPNIIGAYANNDTTSHSAVVNSQDVMSIEATAYTGSHYDHFGKIQFEVAATGTVSSTSSPGDIVLYTTPDGSNTPAEAMRVKSDKSVAFASTTATTVPYLDANKILTSSAVTPTQLSYVDTTSSIQTQLNGKAVSGHDQTVTLAHGTYTPTLTNISNLDSSTAYQSQYMRVGNVVTVSGMVTTDATIPATAVVLGISLPIASDITAAQNVGGAAAYDDHTGKILGDSTNNRAEMTEVPATGTAHDMSFSFTYLIQ